MGLYAQAEDEILQQAETPTTHEIRVALKAARRLRQKARKIAAKRYDALQSWIQTRVLHVDWLM